MVENKKIYVVTSVGTDGGRAAVFLQAQDDDTDVLTVPTDVVAMTTLASKGAPIEHRNPVKRVRRNT